MKLARLDIFNVRNIREQTLYPAPGFNFIHGKNGSGKSALIEAVHVLGRAKSFRTSSIKPVITFLQKDLIVAADIVNKQSNVHIGIRMDGNEMDIRINQRSNRKRVHLAYELPLQIIHPKSFELLDSGSKIRREFLDWGIFHHNEKFLEAWRRYKQALLQRNVLLKAKSVNQLHVWNNELVYYGMLVTRFREEYLTALSGILNQTTRYFLNYTNIDFQLMTGWSKHSDLNQELVNDLEKDLRYGYTNSGPHRGDFQLLIDKISAKDILSRGQLKLLVFCLKLAQVELIIKEKNEFGCLLIDDFAAELDRENRLKALKYLQQLNCQAFITTTEYEDFGDLSFINNFKVFHVEHGKIKQNDVPHGTSIHSEDNFDER